MRKPTARDYSIKKSIRGKGENGFVKTERGNAGYLRIGKGTFDEIIRRRGVVLYGYSTNYYVFYYLQQS
jgi:hypothetical protein